MTLRRILFQLHLWSGLTVGAVALLVGLTGSAIVFYDETDAAFLGQLSKSPSPDLRVDLDQVLEKAAAFAPDQPLSTVSLPSGPFETLRFRFAEPGKAAATVYADPGTGRILGVTHAERGVLWYLREFHFNFLLGPKGLLLNGAVALVLAAMCLSGIYLWWPRRPRLVDLHTTIGVWSAAGLLLIALTGAYSVWPLPVMNAIHTITRTAMPPFTPDSVAGPVSLDQTLRAARAALPEGVPTLIRVPSQLNKAVSVQMRLPGEWHEGGASPVYIERGSARVLRIDRFSRMPLGYRIYSSFGPLHFGEFGIAWGGGTGLAVKLLWVLLGLAPGALIITGFVMWRSGAIPSGL